MPYAGIVQRLAYHAGAHTGDRFSPFERNDLVAVDAPICSFARRDEAPCKLDSILNTVIDVFLNRSAAAPSACHAQSTFELVAWLRW